MDTPHILVASHRRSGTHLTIDTIRNNFTEYSQNSIVVLDQLDDRFEKYQKPLEFVTDKLAMGPTVIKTHFLPQLDGYIHDSAKKDGLEELIQDSKKIYVYRDGRDVMVSLYNYIGGYNPTVKAQSFSEFIRTREDFESNGAVMSRPQLWKYHYQQWTRLPGVYVLQFKDLILNYDDTLIKLANYIQIQPQSKQIDVRRSSDTAGKIKLRLQSLLGVAPKHTSVKFRSGKSGGFKDYFSEQDLEFFYSEVGYDFFNQIIKDPAIN